MLKRLMNINSKNCMIVAWVLLILYNLIVKINIGSFSFWYDEVWRANLITCQDYFKCIREWYGTPVSPGLGFVSHVFTLIFGNYELAVRLPQVASTIAIPLLAGLATRRFVGNFGAWLVALFFTAMFKMSVDLIQYKPYAVDVAFTLLMVNLLQNSQRWKYSHAFIPGIALLGGFISSAIFLILPGVYITLLYKMRHSFKQIKQLVISGALAGGISLLWYIKIIEPQANDYIYDFWKDGFPVGGFAEHVEFFKNWYQRMFFENIFTKTDLMESIGYPFNSTVRYLSSIMLVVGLIMCATKRSLELPLFMAVTTIVTGVLSILKIWPFGFRFNSFYFALLSLLAVIGVGGIRVLLRDRDRLIPAIVSLGLFCLVTPVEDMIEWAKFKHRHDRIWSELRPLSKQTYENTDPESKSAFVTYHWMAGRNSYYYLEVYPHDVIKPKEVQYIYQYPDDPNNEKLMEPEMFSKFANQGVQTVWLIFAWESGGATRLKVLENAKNGNYKQVKHMSGYHLEVYKMTYEPPS